METATSASDMNTLGWRLHALRGNLKDHWSVQVSGNWRITFKFDERGHTEIVDYHDYH